MEIEYTEIETDMLRMYLQTDTSIDIDVDIWHVDVQFQGKLFNGNTKEKNISIKIK